MASDEASGPAYGATRRADRPRRHQGTSDAEQAILNATERLLAQVPLSEISVADILAETGLARATFYFYFSSKYAVVVSLLGRLYDDMYVLVEPFVGEDDRPPDAALRDSIQAAAAFWSEHRPALQAVHEHWSSVLELRAAWLEIIARYTDAVATRIECDRAAGIAPKGPDGRQLAAALLWGTDRCMYVAGLGLDEDMPSEQAIVEPVLALWLGAIYGHAGGAKPKRGKRR
jgi:AcrR family transcriptional regulator